MPLIDIVVDTNVFVHASNHADPNSSASATFLAALSASTTLLCVDEGFDVDEARNASLIGGEYAQHLVIGMLGFAVVQSLAAGGRLKQVSRKVPENIRRAVKRLVPRNPRDRVFVHVAVNSDEKTLVSHDFDDFDESTRRDLQRAVGIEVITAEEGTPPV